MEAGGALFREPGTTLPGNLVAMYHYVRPANSDGVTGVTPAVFEDQVRRIADHYRPVTVEEYVATHATASGMALITFDDAVSDQFDYAFPILEQLGVPSVVFAPMRPYSDEPDGWTTQHLLHALAQELGWAELDRRVVARIGETTIDLDEMNRLYHYEVPEKRRLKYTLAFALPQPEVRVLLADVNTEVGLAPEDWFMSAAELREIQSAGHAIGGHGFDHAAYATLTPKDQAADMHRALETMSHVCGAMARPVAFPFGSFTAETEPIALGLGYTHCFGVEERVDAMHLAGGGGGQ